MSGRSRAAALLVWLALAGQAQATMPPREVGKVVSLANVAASGAIGAAAVVTDVRAIVLNETTTGLTLTLPNPTDASVVAGIDVLNVGSASFTMYGRTVAAGSVLRLAWSGSAWVAAVASASSPTVPSYTVANLPTSGNTAGQLAWASNGRAFTYTAALVIGQEAAGAGTGVLCSWNGSKWEIVGTTMAPSA